MDPFEPTIDDSFREYADLQMRRNTLLSERDQNEQEIDSLEDRLTELWDRLDDRQRRSLNGMASDLNWLKRRGQPPPQGRSAEDISPLEQQELFASKQANESHRFLHSLRVCAPCMPAATLAWLRGQAYAQIGFSRYAISFFELAADLEPANEVIGQGTLLAIDRVDHALGVARAERILASPVKFPPAVVALSAAMVLMDAEASQRDIDKGRFRSILDDAIRRLRLEPRSDDAQASIYQFVAIALEVMGDLSGAVKCYQEGLKLAPDHATLLIGKGLLLYGTQTEEAVAALERVIRNEGTPVVWPYYLLAHYHIIRGQYNESLKMAKLAWERAVTDRVRAELLEWQAICLGESGYPPEVVRPWFEKALALDPTNKRIKQNLAAYEQSPSAGQERRWDIEDAGALSGELSPHVIGLVPLGVV